MFHIHSHKSKRSASPHWDSLFVTEAPARRVVHKSHTTAYDRHSLASDIYRACMKTFGYVGEAESTAIEVCKHVESWLVDKEEVTLADIRRQAARALHMYNPRAAYEYEPTEEFAVQKDEYGFIRL